MLTDQELRDRAIEDMHAFYRKTTGDPFMEMRKYAVEQRTLVLQLIETFEYLLKVRDIKCLHTWSREFDPICANCKSRALLAAIDQEKEP